MAIRLDRFSEEEAFRKKPSPGFGNVYWIRPIFGASDSNGYVGVTCRALYQRLYGHTSKSSACFQMRSAIQKHGTSNFTIEFLETDVPTEELGEREVYWIAQKNTYFGGYNATKGGEDIPELGPEGRAKHKKTMNSDRVVALKRKTASSQWKEGGSLRTKWRTTFAKTAATSEYKEKKSKAAKEIRSRSELEIQRGLAKRRTTLAKRAAKRAALTTDAERRAFDAEIRKRDKHLAKKGLSMTQRRIAEGSVQV